MKPVILFVDDELNILRGLQRNLRKMRNEWDMVFVNSGAAALDHLASNHVDVVITDMRMPVMDGAELLTEVTKRAPRTIRFVLSGQADREDSLRLVGVCHQFLSKPCKTDFFVEQARRALKLRDILPDEGLQTQVANLNDLPSQPAVYDEIVEELSLDEPSAEKIAALVSRDIALAAKLLQIASSGFFSVGRGTPSLSQAVTQLGVKRVNALVVSQGVVKKYEHSETGSVCLDDMWNHSVISAGLSQALAKAEAFDTKAIESTFVAGLVHDIGRLLLAANEPEQYQAAMAGVADPEGIGGLLAETKAFRASHALIGAYLTGLWGLPNAVVQAVAYHHTPRECPNQGIGILTMLYAAEGLINEVEASEANTGSQLDIEYFEGLGLADRLAEWRSIAAQVVNGEPVT